MSSFKNRFNNFFFFDDEEEMTEGAEKIKTETPPIYEEKKRDEKIVSQKSEKRQTKKSGGENVVAINQKQALQKPQITIVEPRLYSEVQEVSDYLLTNQSVIVNFRRMDYEQAIKMIDFLMGVTYAIKGDVRRLGDEIFICTPQSVSVNGSELSEFAESFM